jgi:hypothetical protein
MKKFLLGLTLIFCFALPYAAQAQVIVAVGTEGTGHHHRHHDRHHRYNYLNQ